MIWFYFSNDAFKQAVVPSENKCARVEHACTLTAKIDMH